MNKIIESIYENWAFDKAMKIEGALEEELSKTLILYWLIKKTEWKFLMKLTKLEIIEWGDTQRLELHKNGRCIKIISVQSAIKLTKKEYE